MDNFMTLTAGGFAEEDLVGDGWTDIFRLLTGVAAFETAQKLGRQLSAEELAELIELADMRKMEDVRARARTVVEDPATADALQPWYRQFCKRPCFHDEYLPAFNRPNVTLVDTDGKGVQQLTEHGVVVDGVEYEVDCLIFATGFEVGTTYTRRAGYDIVGRDGLTLSEKWEHGLRTLHGLQTHGFPNCFFLGFTQTAVTVNVPHALDEQARHLTYIVSEAARRDARIVEATLEGEEAWCEEMRAKQRLGVAFYEACTPGYYNNEGKLGNPNGFFAGMYGGGPVAFFALLDQWRATGELPGVELR